MAGIFKVFRGDEISLTPYEAHKDYLVYISDYTGSYYEPYYEVSKIFNNPITSSADLMEMEVSLSVFSYDAIYEGGDFFPDEFGKYQAVTSASGHARTTNGYFKRAMHSSIQGMYYTKPDDACWTLDNSGYDKEYRELGHAAQIISIPQRMHGEAIRKGSVLIRSGSVANRITLRDDGNGNLYDELLTGSAASGSIAVSQSINYVSQSLICLNFSDLYNKAGTIVTVHSDNQKSLWKQKHQGHTYNISNNTRFFERSVYPNKVALNLGEVARDDDEGAYVIFNGVEKTTLEDRAEEISSSFMEITPISTLDLRKEDDYTIAMRISCSDYQPVSASTVPATNYNHAYILHKQNYTTPGGAHYPYSLRQVLNTAPLDNSYGPRGHLQAQIKCGSEFIKINTTGSVTGSGNKWWDVAITKENTTMSLWLDGEKQGTASLPSGSELHNFAPITLGATRTWAGQYETINTAVPGATQTQPMLETRANWKGGISNFVIFNKALSPAEISCHVATGGKMANLIGNVFYNHGIITLTSEKARYKSGVGGKPMFSECTLSFENTHNIIEHQYTCNIKEREYMYTMNPTIMDDNKLMTIKHYVTQSEWSPYITTIGLYDEHARLLAVGKTSRAIKKSEDYDTTIIVRFDT